MGAPILCDLHHLLGLGIPRVRHLNMKPSDTQVRDWEMVVGEWEENEMLKQGGGVSGNEAGNQKYYFYKGLRSRAGMTQVQIFTLP